MDTPNVVYQTLVCKWKPDKPNVVKDAMVSATKLYNGLIWNLRDERERTGKANISKKNLN